MSDKTRMVIENLELEIYEARRVLNHLTSLYLSAIDSLHDELNNATAYYSSASVPVMKEVESS